jgi:hypothetical protein
VPAAVSLHAVRSHHRGSCSGTAGQRRNIGEYTYDALNVIVEKRESNRWSGRISYTLVNSRGTTSGALTATNTFRAGVEQRERQSPQHPQRGAERHAMGVRNLAATTQHEVVPPIVIGRTLVQIDATVVQEL